VKREQEKEEEGDDLIAFPPSRFRAQSRVGNYGERGEGGEGEKGQLEPANQAHEKIRII
jgi:hypothetical protein